MSLNKEMVIRGALFAVFTIAFVFAYFIASNVFFNGSPTVVMVTMAFDFWAGVSLLMLTKGLLKKSTGIVTKFRTKELATMTLGIWFFIQNVGYMTMVASNYYIQHVGSPSTNDDSVVVSILGYSILSLFIAPFFEEIFYRGILVVKLSKFKWFKRLDYKIIIVISAIAFALAHGSITSGVPMFVLGLFLGFIAYNQQSVRYTMMFHIGFNFLTFVLPYYIFMTSASSVVYSFIISCGAVYLVYNYYKSVTTGSKFILSKKDK